MADRVARSPARSAVVAGETYAGAAPFAFVSISLLLCLVFPRGARRQQQKN